MQAPRFPLALVIIAATVFQTACQTHDRRIYTTHRDKNLHTPNPFAPSTSKAADDATSSLGLPSEPAASSNPSAPGLPLPPVNQ